MGENDVAPNHRRDDRVRRKSLDGRGQDVAAVAQHSDPVGQFDDFVDAMRGKDDRDARGGELPDNLEKDLAFRRRQRGGRLIHHQDPGVERQRLGDLDQLLFSDPEIRHAALRVDVDPKPREQPLRRPGDAAAIHDRAGDQRLAAEEDVVRRR